MNVFKYPEQKDWPALLARPVLEAATLEKKVSRLLDKVKKGGDKAVRKLTAEFDGVKLKKLAVSEKEMKAAVQLVPEELKQAIQTAKANIEKFHRTQLRTEEAVETMPGVLCWRKSVGIEKVGLYIPGGSAPLFSTILMLGIPATIAGCKEIVLCTPPFKDGSVTPVVLYTASLLGIKKIFKAGGVQAIGAMAYGTETIPRVYKIFGPGNQYVTAAKQLIQKEGVAIDMPAGPSEVAILADETADPVYVAADLLSQAEHGADSQVMLVTTHEAVIESVIKEVKKQLAVLPRKDVAAKALANSKAILLKNDTDAMELLNAYAGEHLILNAANAEELAAKVINAGSVFLGPYSPESAGDYASGTNHTLPTNGYAKAYSGVSVDSFVKKITFQQLSKAGIQQLGKAVELMAAAEGLQAHKHAVSVRINNE